MLVTSSADDPLAEIPLFAGLDAAARERVGRRLAERILAPGETLFREGDPGGSLAVVLEGELEVFTAHHGREQHLAKIGPGGHVGELSVLDGAPRSATARALRPTRLASLSSVVVREEVIASPGAAQAMLVELARRLRRATVQIGEHVARNAVREVEDRMSWSERLADRIALVNGSWVFIFALLVLTGVWALANAALAARAFDPYPYVFFNLLLGIAVSLQGPLIMMSQNRQASKDRAQAVADYDVNLKNELGIQALQRDLARLDRKLEELRAEGAKGS
ncbi:MAG TPA: DUF1003 domain-containing protein [Anaeromyxobacter sp.]|nr:DUF1003 domain-containing protein [Anaeromyxobacter sp.]